MFNRVFLIVLDSLGVGEADDAAKFGDTGSNTLGHIIENTDYNLNVLEKLGLLNLVGKNIKNTRGYYMKGKPVNAGKDTLNGHYEMMGIDSEVPYKTFPNGFPSELISELEEKTGRKVIGNVAESGTKIIEELGEMHMKTGAIIVYTSADSVLQIAAHEDIIPLEKLYKICKIAREITKKSEFKVGRIIARPFVGKPGNFVRTSNRDDFALKPEYNCLDILKENNLDVIALGKIGDIFADKGIKIKIKTKNNLDGLIKLIDFSKNKFTGLCFLNLNDFDSLYGHRRNKNGYLKCLEEFNYYLPIFLKNIKKDDLIIITADHGNDPTYKGTDHTRENVPILFYSSSFKESNRLEDRKTFADISATILDNYNIKNSLKIGTSILDKLK